MQAQADRYAPPGPPHATPPPAALIGDTRYSRFLPAVREPRRQRTPRRRESEVIFRFFRGSLLRRFSCPAAAFAVRPPPRRHTHSSEEYTPPQPPRCRETRASAAALLAVQTRLATAAVRYLIAQQPPPCRHHATPVSPYQEMPSAAATYATRCSRRHAQNSEEQVPPSPPLPATARRARDGFRLNTRRPPSPPR